MLYHKATVSELAEQINGNIYCFGAGRAFESFVEEFKCFHLEKNIKAIVDRSANEVDTIKKKANGFLIPVISIRQMLSEISTNDRIIITTAAYEEVIGQLNQYERLNNVIYYIYIFLRIEQYDYDRLQVKMPSCLSAQKKIHIPKVIHYCWFGKKEIPLQYKRWMEGWKKYCPDYEIIEWNEENYDVRKNRYMSQAYEMGKWSFVSDYARIDIINQYGGVYLDTDVELVKNLDTLLANNAFCGFESSRYVAFGLGFGSKKDNSILGEILEYYNGIDFLLENGGMNQTACPVIQTKIMRRHGLKCNGEFQIVDGMTVYPSRILCGMSPHSFRIEKSLAYTYAIHHYAGSWLENDQGKKVLVTYLKKHQNNNYFYPDL